MSKQEKKMQFQVNHGSGWKTIAEVAAIDGIFHPPDSWLMMRALGKRVVYPEPISPTALTIKAEGLTQLDGQSSEITWKVAQDLSEQG